jgi:hypothetical protein
MLAKFGPTCPSHAPEVKTLLERVSLWIILRHRSSVHMRAHTYTHIHPPTSIHIFLTESAQLFYCQTSHDSDDLKQVVTKWNLCHLAVTKGNIHTYSFNTITVNAKHDCQTVTIKLFSKIQKSVFYRWYSK